MGTPPKDPRHKPKVWKALISNPFDSALWSMYMGKPWISWSVADYNYQDVLQAKIVELSEKRSA